jgi:hypothetical protein
VCGFLLAASKGFQQLFVIADIVQVQKDRGLEPQIQAFSKLAETPRRPY